MAKGLTNLRALQGPLVLLILGMTAFVVVLFRRYENRQALDTVALRNSEEIYRAVAEDTPILIRRFRPGGEITYVNAAYCNYFGKASEEL